MRRKVEVAKDKFFYPTRAERRWLGLLWQWCADKSTSVQGFLTRLFVHMVRDEGMNPIAAERAIEELKRHCGPALWLLFHDRARVDHRPLVTQPAPTFWQKQMVRHGIERTVSRSS